MNDITEPSTTRREEGAGLYLSHMLELEYGVTSQFATELMVEWFEDLETREVRFAGFRWENRFRLFDREVPLNPMLYVEYEDLHPRTRYKMEVSGWILPPYKSEGEAEPDRERILETRLVLSQDIGPVNLAFNWINETELTTGYTAFGYSAGVMWMIGHHGGHAMEGDEDGARFSCPMHPEVGQAEGGSCPKCGMALVEARKKEGPGGVGAGLEFFGSVGDTKAFGLNFARQEHYLGPILMYHPTSRLMIHTQLAIGLSKASDNMVRLNVAFDF